jgi:hypothetical protein
MTGLYSPINKLMEQVTRPKGTGAEYMAELAKKPGYKPAEAEDRDLQMLMALPQMERAAFMEKLKGQKNKFPLKMREIGGTQTHHESYTLPGGENYREMLLHTPMPEGKGFEGQSYHFGGAPNVIASIRAKDRTSPEGKKILHLEEIQSDWHQAGREEGYQPADLDAQIKEISKHKARLAHEGRRGGYYLDPEDRFEHDNAVEEVNAEFERLDNLKEMGVPRGPHAKDWHELALKSMIQHAAENGYDQIAITPGVEQAKRYGLSKQVGSVSYNPETQHFQAFKPNRETITNEKDATPERVKALIGKEAAAKLLQAPQQMGHHYLEGEDLDIGGEGMKGFYDKMVPTFLNKFGKKHGVQVQPGAINTDNPNGHSQTDMLRASGVPESQWGRIPYEEKERMMAEYSAKQPPSMTPVHTFDITPEMREDVLKNGIPRYAEGGEVDVRPTNYDPNLQRKHPELEAAIRGIAAGTTTHKQLDQLIAKHKPIKPYEFVPQPATDEDAERALKPAQKPKWRGHEQWPAGRKVGLRLDIPAYENHGVWVNSVHDEEGKDDDNLKVAYGSHSSVKNAVFDPTPHKAEEVGRGEKGKSSFARIKGDLHHMTEDEAVQHMKTYLNHPAYAQVGMDPRRHGFFYDRKTLKPVTHSAHVVQIGPLVLAHKPTYGKRESYAKGGSVSRGTVKEKVTISPDMDVMQYELITKKVK